VGPIILSQRVENLSRIYYAAAVALLLDAGT